MSSEKVVRIVAFASIAVLVLILIALYRRLRPTATGTPYIHQAAAALGLVLGIGAFLAGVGHSVAVISLAVREAEDYAPLTVLRFTTGAMLMYAGAVNLAIYRAIRAGQPWAIATALASCLLFVMYLLFLFPLPGTGGSVPRLLGLWSVYLAVLAAAALTHRRHDHAAELI